MKKTLALQAVCTAVCILFSGCGSSGSSSSESTLNTEPATHITEKEVSTITTTTESATEMTASDKNTAQEIDYMALVNKLNPLPGNWENTIETVHCTNSIGDDVEVEKKAYDAYLELKTDLEADGIYVDLDSARRSVKQQQQIMDQFTKEYGADYAAKTVAKPGYSEHHTGLALDLYLIIDGKDITLNEEMVKYPEIWAKIHEKLADYGFILRYLEDKEHITGYGYEPWHIRYIDDTSAAKEIMSDNLTLEEYLGAVKTSDVTVDLGSSGLFTEDELKEAAVQVKCRFATFEGCELHSLRYAGDESNNEDNLEHIKEIDGAVNYSQVIEFLSDFRADDKCEIFESDSEISDYQWWLAREEGGGWQLIDWGY